MHEMKCVISDFSSKLKSKDLVVLQLQRRVRELEEAHSGIQVPLKSDQASETMIDAKGDDPAAKHVEQLKEQIRGAQNQERKLLLLLNDQKQLIEEMKSRSIPPKQDIRENKPCGNAAFDILYITKIAEEQERVTELRHEIESLKGMSVHLKEN